MDLATRCPQCGTAFRLVADQLRLHDGLVRCGACSAIFDGRQNQFEVDPAALPGSSNAPISSPPVEPMTPTFVDAPPPTPISPPIPERLPELSDQEPAPQGQATSAAGRADAAQAGSASRPETLSEPVDPALLGPATRLGLPQTPVQAEPPVVAEATPDTPVPPEPFTGAAGPKPVEPPAPRPPTPPAPVPPKPPGADGRVDAGTEVRDDARADMRSDGRSDPRPDGRADARSDVRPETRTGFRPSLAQSVRPIPPTRSAATGASIATPATPTRDVPEVKADDASARGYGAREPSLHEPIPLAPSGDANLLHAPQSFGAREVPDSSVDQRREPRFIDPAEPLTPASTTPVTPPSSPAVMRNPRSPELREPSLSTPPAAPSVRASIIDNGLPAPRLRTRADGSIPDLQARLRADAEAEAVEDHAMPELRRESADPTEPLKVEPARDLPAEPIYAWDPETEDTAEPAAPVVVDAPPRGLLEEPEEPRAPRRIWPWVLGVMVAALALGAQAVWVWRDEIATNLPITRPLLSSICAPLGCTVGYPRHPELLSIESSALEPWQSDATASPDPGASNRLALRVVLRNRHSLPQPWPSIELTLTDLSDAAVVRRVLSPSDYLPADTIAKPMPPRSERSLRVPVDPPAEAVSGYRLSVFFP